MSVPERVARDYRAAFLRYLSRLDEVGLTQGYEIGRRALSQGTTVLDVAVVHHEVLLEVMADTTTEELAAVARAASEFLLEVLAPYAMERRTAGGQAP